MPRTLLAWIGHADLKAAGGEAGGVGPIANALQALEFNRVVLLSDYAEGDTKSYVKWVSKRTKADVATRIAPLTSPTDFGEIYMAASQACAEAERRELTFHLSPGTPAMAAVWILLSKTRFPAQLIESSPKFGVKSVKVPFDIAMDFVPELLREQDARMRSQAVAEPPEAPEFADIIHRSKEMSRLIERARRVSLHNVPVLIEGESGTGKELLARLIHRASPRRNKKIMAVNCGAIPKGLVIQLFGHGRAPSPAHRNSGARFERRLAGALPDEVELRRRRRSVAACRRTRSCVGPQRRRWTCGSSQLRTGRLRTRSTRERSARTCSFGSQWRCSRCRRCASARGIWDS
jgi:hypothetical protein